MSREYLGGERAGGMAGRGRGGGGISDVPARWIIPEAGVSFGAWTSRPTVSPRTSLPFSIWTSDLWNKSNKMQSSQSRAPFPSLCPALTTDPLNLAQVEKNRPQSRPGAHLQPTGQPARLQTVLRKIGLSFLSYLSCGLHRAAGDEGHLIRPCTALWCEKALRRFDSPLLRSRKLLAIIDIGFPC